MTSAKNVRAFQRALLRWYRHNGRDLPWRRTRDPYAVLVSEFMLQQTQVVTVVPFYESWMQRFTDFAALARASEDDVLHSWQGLGYYARARNLHATAKTIVARYGGRFPQCVEQMQQLPGIGEYTAHALASFAFNQAVPVVEANTARALARLFDFHQPLDSHGSRQTLWRYAASLVPKSGARIYNSALMDLGALVCIPREPKCGICPVKKFCRAKKPELLPIRKSPPEPARLVEKHSFVIRQGKILLERSSQRWRGMWILPPLKSDCLKQSSLPRRPVYRSVFSFTHHRVGLVVYRCRARERIAPGQRWFDSIERAAMPSPHRRAAQNLLQQFNCVGSRHGCLSIEP